LRNRLHRARQRVRVGIDEQCHPAFSADELTGRRANARAAAGDQSDLAFDPVHTSAPNPKFAPVVLQGPVRTSGSKGALES
jgi:hypothetical protein